MSENNMSRPRFDHIDLLEFFAIFAVLIYHSYIYPWEFNVLSDPAAPMNYNCMGILSVCVPLFFLTNGYLLFNRPLDIRKHLRKTLRMIVLTILWAVGCMLLLMPVKQEFLSLPEIIYGIMTWKEGWIHHLWFMGALVCLYIFFPLLKTAYDHQPKAFYYFLIFCAVMTFGNKLLNMAAVLAKYVLTGVGTDFQTNWFNIFNPFSGMYGYAFVYFGLGGLLYQWESRIREWLNGRRLTLLTALMVLSCILMAVWGQFYYRITGIFWDIVFKGYDTVFVFLNVLVIYCISLYYRPKTSTMLTKFVALVSKNTLGIYFLHQLLFYATVEQLKAFPLLCTLPGGILYSFAVLCLCTLITWYFKKLPILRLLV